jgi:hypothetical protein
MQIVSLTSDIPAIKKAYFGETRESLLGNGHTYTHMVRIAVREKVRNFRVQLNRVRGLEKRIHDLVRNLFDWLVGHCDQVMAVNEVLETIDAFEGDGIVDSANIAGC